MSAWSHEFSGQALEKFGIETGRAWLFYQTFFSSQVVWVQTESSFLVYIHRNFLHSPRENVMEDTYLSSSCRLERASTIYIYTD